MPLHLSFVTLWFFLWITLLMPFMAWLGYRRLRSPKPLAPPRKRYPITIAALILTAVFALQAADNNGLDLSYSFTTVESLIGLVFLISLVSGARRGFRLHPERTERARRLFGSSTPAELFWALLMALSAGLCEEIAYRGVLYGLMLRLLGNAFLVVLVCTALFALAHITQGWRAVLFTALLAFLFHILFILSQSLLVPIAIHTLYDAAVFVLLYKQQAPIPQPAQSFGQSA